MTDREDALRELGEILKERREQAGLTLDDVYDRTRIRLEYLTGIEAGDYTNFPEIVYIKGFVRTYLKLINAEDMQDEFMARLDQNNNPRKHEREAENVNIFKNSAAPASLTEGFKPASHFWIFSALIAALIGTGIYVWYAFTYGGLKFDELFSFNKPAAKVETQPEKIHEPDQEKLPPVAVVKSKDEKPAPPVEPKKPEIKPVLELRAVNDVWLRVTINGNNIFGGTIKRGENRTFNLTAPARVLIGRPSALQVIHNGKDLGVVNPRAKKSETYIYNPDGTHQLAQ